VLATNALERAAAVEERVLNRVDAGEARHGYRTRFSALWANKMRARFPAPRVGARIMV
jgi:hypothetical protein